MKELTLRELCTNIGVSRRAVQGYERLGLVSASGKNERGYLLYDSSAQTRIRQIYQYQQFGFAVKDIKSLLDASPAVLRNKLQKQLALLLSRRSRMDENIRELTDLIQTLGTDAAQSGR